ncbi:MAG TPA: BON domain-containing protein [Candidatus Limnocylindria bacterium]|jgi:osmotically-inducible protein OsmY
MRRLLSTVLVASLGAAAAFLFDPERGRGRRARLVDQAAASLRRVGRGLQRQVRLLGGRAGGRLTAMRIGDGADEPANDATLKDRVEGALLGDPAIPKGDININAEQGIVVLRGEVPDDAIRTALEQRAAQVRGVWYVENLLHLPGEPAMSQR